MSRELRRPDTTMKFLDVPKSGSHAALTFGHNRFGQYVRNRSIPVNPNTTYQSTQRSRMVLNAAAYRSLTADQRAGWATLGDQIHRTDALGQDYTLTGLQAFCMVNNNLLDAGESTVTTAPALTSPTALTSMTVTTTGGTLSVAFTATPLAANNRCFLYASPQRSAGRNFEGDYRLILVSAAAAASPLNALSAYTTRFGAPVVGYKIFFQGRVHVGGFVSSPCGTSKIVTA